MGWKRAGTVETGTMERGAAKVTGTTIPAATGRGRDRVRRERAPGSRVSACMHASPIRPAFVPSVVLGALLAALAVAAPGLSAPARAQSPTFNGNGQTQSGDCQGGDSVVNGNRNEITLKGYCRHVTVRGNNNHVLIELTSSGHITVPGNDNRIDYRLPPGGLEPERTILGNRNEIRLVPGTSETPVPRGGVSGHEPD